jgi:apolipoprotein N-acyltransferase
MKVSITEDATTSLTRVDGAIVVRSETIRSGLMNLSALLGDSRKAGRQAGRCHSRMNADPCKLSWEEGQGGGSRSLCFASLMAIGCSSLLWRFTTQRVKCPIRSFDPTLLLASHEGGLTQVHRFAIYSAGPSIEDSAVATEKQPPFAPWLSVCRLCFAVNGIGRGIRSRSLEFPGEAGGGWQELLAQEFVQVFDKAQNDNHEGTRDSRKEDRVERTHQPSKEQRHGQDSTASRSSWRLSVSYRMDGRLAAMGKLLRQPWTIGIFCAGLLMLPYPIAGPTPYWRTFFAWVAFVPLLWAVLAPENLGRPYAVLRGAFGAYVMGVLWYAGNCYWIYQTMLYYGGLPPLISVGILVLYSLVLGLYFAAFGFGVTVIAKTVGRPHAALLAAPFLWVGLELLSAHLTKVPWDLLGYSQIDNFLLTRLAPVAGVYGISFVLMAGNALIAQALFRVPLLRVVPELLGALLLVLLLQNGDRLAPAAAPVEATAVLVQQNLNVNQDNVWSGPEYQRQVGEFARLSRRTCGPYLAGIPELDAYPVTPDCPSHPVSPGIIAWPESPAPFHDRDSRFVDVLRAVAIGAHAPIVAGNTGIDPHGDSVDRYNSALFVGPDGSVLGRYDKVHLVPWGEYIPFKDFFSFAKNLTQEAGDLTHGWRRIVFRVDGHTFGVFICYEEIFGDEIRIFVRDGAQVLVNISDDGWYGDSSAPWQTLNMSRMRAVENRRWLLRDTNTGLTTVIDPYGRLTASIGRHELTSLAAKYGYRSDLTFYTKYGDVFAGLCGIISVIALAASLAVTFRRRRAQSKVRESVANQC